MSANDEKVDEQRHQMAKRLREARVCVGMSQDEVSAVLGVSRPAVTNLEAGTRKVEAVELDRLARLYRRPVQYFLSGEEAAINALHVGFLARTLDGLSPRDIEEVSRFAEFLKHSPKPGRGRKKY